MLGKFFSWLLSFFWTPSSPLDLYHPKERLIYAYFTGKEIIKADPMILYRKFKDKEVLIDSAIKAIRGPESKWKEPERINFIKYIREIFDLKSFEEEGLTELELSDLFNHFLTYCGDVKKNSNQSQTSSTPTEDSKSSSEADQPISNSSDSGLTKNESSIDKQESLPTDQQSPLDLLPPDQNTMKQ